MTTSSASQAGLLAIAAITVVTGVAAFLTWLPSRPAPDPLIDVQSQILVLVDNTETNLRITGVSWTNWLDEGGDVFADLDFEQGNRPAFDPDADEDDPANSFPQIFVLASKDISSTLFDQCRDAGEVINLNQLPSAVSSMYENYVQDGRVSTTETQGNKLSADVLVLQDHRCPPLKQDLSATRSQSYARFSTPELVFVAYDDAKHASTMLVSAAGVADAPVDWRLDYAAPPDSRPDVRLGGRFVSDSQALEADDDYADTELPAAYFLYSQPVRQLRGQQLQFVSGILLGGFLGGILMLADKVRVVRSPGQVVRGTDTVRLRSRRRPLLHPPTPRFNHRRIIGRPSVAPNLRERLWQGMTRYFRRRQ